MKFKFIPFPELVTEKLTLWQTTKNNCVEILFLRSDKEVDKITKGIANG